MKSLNEQFKGIFPKTVKISQNILNKANINDTKKCNGSLGLRKALGKKGLEMIKDEQQSWGISDGNQKLKDGSIVVIESVNDKGERVDMMDLVVPTTVIFRVRQ